MAQELTNELLYSLDTAIWYIGQLNAPQPPEGAYRTSSGIVNFSKVKALGMARQINDKFRWSGKKHGCFYVEADGQCLNVFLRFW